MSHLHLDHCGQPFYSHAYIVQSRPSSMRGRIFISLPWLSTVVVVAARHYPMKTLSSSTPATVSSSILPTKMCETPFLERCAPGGTMNERDLENDIYDMLEPRFMDGPPREKTTYPVKRQQYSVLHGSNDQPGRGPALGQATGSPTSPPGSHMKSTSGPTSIPSHSLIPNWSYKKHSIAAATILIIVVVGAFVILSVLCFKKAKRYFQRCKKERDYSPPNYNAYDCPIVLNADAISSATKLHKEEQGMGQNPSQGTFLFNCGRQRSPSPGFVVEEDPAVGSVTRVYRATKNDIPKSSEAPPCMPSLLPSSLEEGKTTNYIPESPLPISKSCEAEKPVVVVSSPLTHALSISATRETQSSPGALTLHEGYSGMECSEENKRVRYSDPSPDPHRVSYLPMIHPSSSPLFTFDSLQTDE